MSRFEDLTGKRFNRWTVLSRAENHSKCGNAQWLCRCDCGKVKVVVARSLRNGNSRSCGCLIAETTKKRRTKHGQSGHHMSSTYRIWKGMLTRCRNPSATGYVDYGGRGITVCDRWLKFENFFEDMGERPEKMSIDRIDHNKGYSKENCRWATDQQQRLNMTRNKRITAFGKTLCVSEWARELNIPASTIYWRLDNGKSNEDALSLIKRDNSLLTCK
jgi:hypothetical protein